MAKSESKRAGKASTQTKTAKSFIPVDKKAIDSNLSSLFASSLGPVKPPPKSRYQNIPAKKPVEEKEDEEEEEDEADDEDLSSVSEDLYGDEEEDSSEDEGSDSSSSDTEDDQAAAEESESDHETALAKVRESVLNGGQEQPNKKRKRKEEEVEDVYMRKLAREEVKEEEKRKKQKREAAGDDDANMESDESEDDALTIPKHETQTESTSNADEVEKASRTVFLGNVSSEAVTSKTAKKTLLRHLASFIDDLPDHTPPHKVESLRFRSTAFTAALPKKAAYVRKEILDATTKSTNAYAVYSTQQAAREAAKRLNGTMVLNRHLRVDSVAHPAKTDHRRCVFVGNLGFVDDESSIQPEEDGKKKKTRPPGDVEEGLWVHFSKAGKVESVRVVRDPKTRVGKGFAYVQFEDENGVEAALLYNEQKFPPLLPRKLRVTRARAQSKKKDKKPEPTSRPGRPGSVYNAKVTDEQKTHQGRARAMLGKAARSADFVFEGHRATAKQGHSGLKLGGKGKKKGKPSNRSTRRAAAWASAGGKAQFNKKKD